MHNTRRGRHRCVYDTLALAWHVFLVLAKQPKPEMFTTSMHSGAQGRARQPASPVNTGDDQSLSIAEHAPVTLNALFPSRSHAFFWEDILSGRAHAREAQRTLHVQHVTPQLSVCSSLPGVHTAAMRIRIQAPFVCHDVTAVCVRHCCFDMARLFPRAKQARPEHFSYVYDTLALAWHVSMVRGMVRHVSVDACV